MLAVGRSREPAIDGLAHEYLNRSTWPWRLLEVVPKRPGMEDQALLAAVPSGAVVVALDERGRDLASRELAARIEHWREHARPAAAFLIGGPDGHGEAVRARADLVLAFGRMTWPHRLVRVMLAEQLYRATTILAGHPYHRD